MKSLVDFMKMLTWYLLIIFVPALAILCIRLKINSIDSLWISVPELMFTVCTIMACGSAAFFCNIIASILNQRAYTWVSPNRKALNRVYDLVDCALGDDSNKVLPFCVVSGGSSATQEQLHQYLRNSGLARLKFRNNIHFKSNVTSWGDRATVQLKDGFFEYDVICVRSDGEWKICLN